MLVRDILLDSRFTLCASKKIRDYYPFQSTQFLVCYQPLDSMPTSTISKVTIFVSNKISRIVQAPATLFLNSIFTYFIEWIELSRVSEKINANCP